MCSSLLVHATGGLIEAHFHFFVMVPVMALYEDWLPFGLGVGYVLVEHGVVGTVAPEAVYSHAAAHVNPWVWAGIHAVFFAAACLGSLTYWRFAELARLRQQELAETMRHQARHDQLTGLPNRAALLESGQDLLAQATAAAVPVSILMVDLDRFKEVNDTLGHDHGDRLLVQVGARLAGALRPHDLIVRLGGDEFAVLLPEADETSATGVAHELLGALSRGFEVAGIRLDVDASIGCATSVPPHAEDPAAATADLLRRADIAMYEAKQHRTGVRSYRASSDTASIDRLTLLTDLRRAITGDELVMHYQPKVRLADGAVVGVEALVRWQHPDRGLLPPADFIHLAEGTALIGPLTERVLDLAATEARAWADAGQPVQVAVNVSPRSLHDDEFAAAVLAALERHGLPPRLLRLEITETSLMSDAQAAVCMLAQLRTHGIGLSIDDFGTGYSSMSYLRQRPVDELKVDRSFVLGLGTPSVPGQRTEGHGDITPDDDAAIVRSTVQLGHSLGMSVVAEGVESADVLDLLAELGCDNAQGFHIARPMPAAQMRAFLAASPVPVA